ncbi:MAG TPA: iron-sulfur cluster insertion protein ErpA [Candidatus Polarisedimenticolia bacterium]|nr:iron-sulfur cluster insertion protein ErpA [Candidatus Polarisedimenticolia bacterium]
MINVTAVAAEKIKEAMEAEGKPNLHLRIYVEGGGCSGMQYGLVFEEEEQDGDEVLPQNGGFNILIDRFSAPYLTGAEIDFVTTLQGAGFKINNPNATGSCGCGHSFKA